MRFKTPRLSAEFTQLKKNNINLYTVLLELEKFCDEQGLEEPVITCILRTPEENKACNGIPNSPHCVWEGADIRSTIYDKIGIQDMLDFLNKLGYNYSVGKKTAIYHQVPGGAPHFHIQVRRPHGTTK